MGFDDNVFQTPSNQTAPSPVLVQPAIPAVVETVLVPNTVTSTSGTGSLFGKHPVTPVPRFHPVQVVLSPAQKAVYQNVPFTPQQRVESFLMRATLGMDVQFATRQTIFTMDLRGTADTYFDRPGRSTDPNGSIGFNFIHRFTSRFQFDATGTLSYSTQPNVASPNSPVTGDAAYISFNGRTDVSYRWSKRFTTVSSISLNTFEQDGIPGNTSYETIFGTEARYLWSPRLTAVGEVRYAIKTFPNNSLQDSQNTYLLGGADVILSSRFTGTVRVGASFDRFTSAGGSASTPYGETSVAWRFSPTGSVSWSSRYGFEDPPNTNTTVLTFRTGITAVKALSSRLRVSAGVSYANSRSTSQLMTAQTVVSSNGTTNTVFTSNNSTETTMSVSAGVEYLLTRRMTLNTNWTYTDVVTSQKVIDYDRNQIFFGVDYTF